MWTEEHVLLWLDWAKNEFCLDPKLKDSFAKMRGRDMVALGREGFLAIAPPFTGDILWEHLEILQKGEFTFVCFVADQSNRTPIQNPIPQYASSIGRRV